jgi:hypothetical protein
MYVKKIEWEIKVCKRGLYIVCVIRERKKRRRRKGWMKGVTI